MSDMKEFWEIQEDTGFVKTINSEYVKGWKSAVEITKEQQCLFFWERGGKQFVKLLPKFSLKDLIKFANSEPIVPTDCMSANERDFLDCVDCLGEEQVKELIKELEE